MEQQEKFMAAGVNTEYVGEEQKDVVQMTKRRVINGEVQLVYITPENVLLNSRYRQMFRSPRYKQNLVGVAVDEAHCVKTW